MISTLRKWESSFLVVPVVTAAVLVALYGAIYPLLSGDPLHLGLAPVIIVRALAIVAALVIPILVARLYKIRFAVPLAIWIACLAVGLAMDNGSYNGSPHTSLAIDLLVYQIVAVGLTITWVRICFGNYSFK